MGVIDRVTTAPGATLPQETIEKDLAESDVVRSTRGETWRGRLRTNIPWADDLITRSVGKALPSQKPYWNLSGPAQWLLSTSILFGHIGLLSVVVAKFGQSTLSDVVIVPVTITGLISLTGRFRVQAVTFAHHFIHRAGSKKSPNFDLWASHISTALALGPNPADYEDEHVGLHHMKLSFSTINDPDAAFLSKLGFRPGMSRHALYWQLWKTIFSFRFHSMFFYARFKSALLTASWTHKLIVLAWLSIVSSLSALMPWWVFLIVIIVPLGPLYQISALLQLLTEHRWMVTKGNAKTRFEYANRCIGRFSLVEPPERRINTLRGSIDWGIWGFKMIPTMLVRLGVWVGDLPGHDWHHIVSMLPGHVPSDWPNAFFERERAIQEGDTYDLAMREAYSLKEALDWVFDGLTEAEM